MNWFKNYRWKPVLAASVGLGVSSPAWGQLPPHPVAGRTPPRP